MRKTLLLLIIVITSFTLTGCKEEISTIQLGEESSLTYRIPNKEWDQTEFISNSEHITSIFSVLNALDYEIFQKDLPFFADNSLRDTSLLYINFMDNGLVYVVDEAGTVSCMKLKYRPITQRIFISETTIDRDALIAMLESVFA